MLLKNTVYCLRANASDGSRQNGDALAIDECVFGKSGEVFTIGAFRTCSAECHEGHSISHGLDAPYHARPSPTVLCQANL